MSDADHIRRLSWPTELEAHVMEAGHHPRVHGIDVHRDLARHYTFAESLLLTLRGEPPTEDEGRAFEVALVFAMPVDVGQAAAHAAALSRICGAKSGSVLAVGALVLAEDASRIVAEHRCWLDCLMEGSTPPEPDPGVPDDAENAAIEALREALPEHIRPCVPPRCPSLDAAVLAVFSRCGLHTSAQLEVALVVSRLGVVQAEALHHRPGHFSSYPMNLPPFRYEAHDE